MGVISEKDQIQVMIEKIQLKWLKHIYQWNTLQLTIDITLGVEQSQKYKYDNTHCCDTMHLLNHSNGHAHALSD